MIILSSVFIISSVEVKTNIEGEYLGMNPFDEKNYYLVQIH